MGFRKNIILVLSVLSPAKRGKNLTKEVYKMNMELYRKYVELKKNNRLENKGDVLIKNKELSFNIEILGK